MQQECTVEDHCAELVEAARRAYADGRKAGSLDGHRLGYDQGYLAGHHDGTTGAAAYKSGDAHGYVNGYLARISDEIAQSQEAS